MLVPEDRREAGPGEPGARRGRVGDGDRDQEGWQRQRKKPRGRREKKGDRRVGESREGGREERQKEPVALFMAGDIID